MKTALVTQAVAAALIGIEGRQPEVLTVKPEDGKTQEPQAPDNTPTSDAFTGATPTDGKQHVTNAKAVEDGKVDSGKFQKADATKREVILGACAVWKGNDAEDWLYGFSQGFTDLGQRKVRKSEAGTIFSAYGVAEVSIETSKGKDGKPIITKKSGALFLQEFNGAYNKLVDLARTIRENAGLSAKRGPNTKKKVSDKGMASIEEAVAVMSIPQCEEMLARCLDRMCAGASEGWEGKILENAVHGGIVRIAKSGSLFWQKLAQDMHTLTDHHVSMVAAQAAKDVAATSEHKATQEPQAKASAASDTSVVIEGEFEHVPEPAVEQKAA